MGDPAEREPHGGAGPCWRLVARLDGGSSAPKLIRQAIGDVLEEYRARLELVVEVVHPADGTGCGLFLNESLIVDTWTCSRTLRLLVGRALAEESLVLEAEQEARQDLLRCGLGATPGRTGWRSGSGPSREGRRRSLLSTDARFQTRSGLGRDE